MRTALGRLTATLALFTAAVLPGAHAAQADEAGATTYHVAAWGSDRNPGTLSRPLRTIARCTRLVGPAGTCLIHQGRYREQVTPPSGAPGAPVTIAAVPGDTVTVDGTEPVTGWRDAGGGLVSAEVTLPLKPDENAVFLDGGRAAEGRWPNSGPDPLNPTWAVADTTSTSRHIDDTDLPDADFTGSTVHIWAGSNPWSQQTGTVTRTTAGQLDFTGGDNRCPPLCMGNEKFRNYYLVGGRATLDQPGEWSYDATAHRLFMVPPTGGMAGHQVTVKVRDWGVDLTGRSHVTVRGLDLWGTSLRTGDTSTGIVVDRLRAAYVSEFSTLPMPDPGDLQIPPTEGNIVDSRVLESGVQILGTGNVLRDSDIGYSAGTGVLLRGSGNTVTGNLIHDVGWMGSYTPGIEINGSGQTVTHNTVRRTGRASIDVSWQLNGVPFHNNRIAYNDLSEAMRTSRDGSPFYVCCNLDASGTSVDHNTVHDSDGQVGYYIDNSSGNFLLHHNAAWNVGTRGTFFNGHSGPSLGNRDHNSSYGGGISTAAVRLSGATDASGTTVTNDVALDPMDIAGPGDPAPVVRGNLVPPTDPLYTDVRNGELWPRAGSPAIDAGEYVPGVTTDVRGAAPDQGAYEYGAPIWSAGCRLMGCQSRVRNDGWTATADGTDASATVDGDQNTRWAGTASQSPSQSLVIDLRTVKTFNRLVLDSGLDATDPAQGFSVSVSRTGSGWGRPVAEVSGRSFAQDAVFRDVSARYVRVTLTATAPGTWGLNEVRLYADGPDAAGPVQAELAVRARGTRPGTAAALMLRAGVLLGFPGVGFGTGATAFKVRLAAVGGSPGRELQLRLDSPDGPVAARLRVRSTGAADTWQEQSVPLTRPVSGIHDAYLTVVGGSAAIAVDWWTATH